MLSVTTDTVSWTEVLKCATIPDTVGMCEPFAADSLTKVTKRPSL